ncbi:hypothetical protein [uncultured Nostoc sp.]
MLTAVNPRCSDRRYSRRVAQYFLITLHQDIKTFLTQYLSMSN